MKTDVILDCPVCGEKIGYNYCRSNAVIEAAKEFSGWNMDWYDK